jgi:TonB family protein
MTCANPRRRNAVPALALCGLCCGLLTGPLPALAAKPSPPVWTGPTGNVVAIEDADTPDDVLGSAVLFPDGRALTVCHIIKNVERLQIRQRTSRSDVSLSYADRKHDLCELKVAHPERFRPVSLKLRDVEEVSVGETVYAVGGAWVESGLSKGNVVKVQGDKGDMAILISARLVAGYSGGALFDSSGALLGIVTYRDRSTRKLSYAYPAQYIRDREDTDAAGDVERASEHPNVPSREAVPGDRTAIDDYLKRLADASRASIKYPEEARTQRWNGTASIHFDVDPGGDLRQSYVETSSGYAGLDVTALLAVRKAIGDVTMPDQVREKGLKGTVSITFTMGEKR